MKNLVSSLCRALSAEEARLLAADPVDILLPLPADRAVSSAPLPRLVSAIISLRWAASSLRWADLSASAACSKLAIFRRKSRTRSACFFPSLPSAADDAYVYSS